MIFKAFLKKNLFPNIYVKRALRDALAKANPGSGLRRWAERLRWTITSRAVLAKVPLARTYQVGKGMLSHLLEVETSEKKYFWHRSEEVATP